MPTPVLTPNEWVPPRLLWMITGGWLLVWMLGWMVFRPAIFPSPVEVLQSIPDLISQDGLIQELTSSFIVNLEALAISMAVSLALAYLSVVPIFRPLTVFVSKLRFVSPAAFLFILVVVTSSGHELKLSLLTFGITVFFVTTMAGVVAAVPKEQFDHARTLRMSEWQIVWYVIIRGTWDQAIDTVRDNAAMGWAMLTMVEGLVRSEGGVGVLILDQNKHLNLAPVYGVALMIIAVGLVQDYALGQIKLWQCPYVAGRKP